LELVKDEQNHVENISYILHGLVSVDVNNLNSW